MSRMVTAVTLSMPSPPAGPVPARMILRTSCGSSASQVEGIADDPFHPLARENSCLQRDLVRRSRTDPSSCASVFSLRVLAYHHEIKGWVAFEWRREARKQACRAIVDVEIEALAQWQ